MASSKSIVNSETSTDIDDNDERNELDRHSTNDDEVNHDSGHIDDNTIDKQNGSLQIDLKIVFTQNPDELRESYASEKLKLMDGHNTTD